MDKRIVPLAMGGLGIGTTEFAIMGLLPDIAQSLHVDIPQAGHFISAYALGVVIGAPLIVGFSIKFPPKKVLIWLMVLFTFFNLLSAIAPNYTIMIITRLLSGLPHGAFFGVSTVVAKRLAVPGKEARYISFVFAGLTLANLAMVPLVTYIGHTFHWSWCFVMVSAIGLLTIFMISLWLPDMEVKNRTSYLTQLNFLKKSQSWYVLLITAIGFGGLFTWLSYISPLMTEVSRIGSSSVAYVMILAGGGMVIGNLLGGYLTDKIGVFKASMLFLSLMMMALLCVFFFSSHAPTSLVLTFLCGILSMALGAPVNIMMLKAAPDSEMMSAAFMQAAFNTANASGAYFGGLPLTFGLSYQYPSLVGVAMTLTGLLICIRYTYKFNRPQTV
ncbi:MFS transporter [Terrimonas ferruginea]|uniref:MFS transporter n=1 Tax=Terrimonas ferruginea TaxID=249 RepID=UPI00040B5FDF|nr:MFS transporter [Terrimonas ferruginea]